ncbi:MAG: hypothetical protein O3A84_05965, partial [Proteobacteria bacterium]|nr:hypothetical protein [Pseudomonadota bacterium]
MKRMIRLVLGLSLLFAFSEAAVSAEIKVVETRFVVRLVNGDGSSLARETNKVPLVPNRICYGWEMRLDTQEHL